MPKVSVAMASYNHEKFVAETMNSVLNQSYQDFEFIITDDGSSDNTADIIRQFKDPRIKLFVFKENQGACVAMNNSIKNSSGEYISIINSDDAWMSDKLEKQIKFLDENPEYVAVFTLPDFIDEDSKEYSEKNHSWLNLFLQPNRTRYAWLNHFFYKSNAICHPSLMIRSSCYKDIGLYNPAFASLPDFDMWIRLCFKYEIYIIQEKLVKFRILEGEANTSGSNISFIIKNIWERSRILKRYFDRINSIEELLKVFPECRQFGKDLEEELIPYYISELILAHQNLKNNPPHILSALNALYKLLINEKTVKMLAEKYGFTYIDFINITGTLDPFNIKAAREQRETITKLKNPHYAQLYIDTGLGFNNKQCITQMITGNENEIEFHISEYSDIKKLRFAPVNNFAVIYIKEILYYNSMENLVHEEDFSSNAFYRDNNNLAFATTNPNITIDIKDNSCINKIKVKLDFIHIGAAAYNFVINQKEKLKSQEISNIKQQLQQKEHQLQQKLQQKNSELQKIYSSDLWKVANKLNDIATKTRLTGLLKAMLTLKRKGFRKSAGIRKLERKKYDIIIKIPVPAKNAEKWGDYHFAVSLKKELEKNKYKTHIQLLNQWYDASAYSDTVIVLRGLSEYKPNPDSFNIMWNISHPDKVTIDEYNKYDYIFVASKKWAAELSPQLKVPVETLLQCTDTELFKPNYSKEYETELLFVGNSRKIFRRIIKDLLPTNYNLSVFGTLWEDIIDTKYLKGQHIPNKELHKYYSSCKILLNDHWDDMRQEGFISNRIFDGFACGSFIISDKIEGADEIFKDALVLYESRDELNSLLEEYLKNPDKRRKKAEIGREIVVENHTFKKRAEKIIETIKSRSS